MKITTRSVYFLTRKFEIDCFKTIQQLYKTVISDLTELKNVTYDVLVFFSPSGIESLFQNFPKFEQNGTKIAVFGSITKKAVEEKGLNVDIYAPSPKFPSMTMALDNYIFKSNKK